MAASILIFLYKVEQYYTYASAGIREEEKDAKSAVTLVIFNSPDKFIPLLAYWAVVLALVNSVFNESNLEYLLCSRRSYMTAQRDALAYDIFKDSVSYIAMNSSAFTDDNARAYDSLIPCIFRNLAEQVLTSIINNKKDFQGFYMAFRAQFVGEVSMTCLVGS